MDALVIKGPAKLKGTVSISGSKNTALPLLFSSLLFDGNVAFENVPRLWDIETTLSLLQSMGCECSWDKEVGTIQIFPRVKNKIASYDWVKKMRAGILALGPLVAKYGEAKVSLPGGCAIGARPVNYHIDAMRQMGVEIEVEEGYIHAHVRADLHGAKIHFPEVTVTGTENLLMVAAKAKGTTILENAAREPEVVALGEWLKLCGVEISGLGTPTITIEGGGLREPLEAARIPADRIETGTWISIAMATGSELLLDQTESRHLGSVIQAFTEMGLKIESLNQGTQLRVTPNSEYRPLTLRTEPYPGFPTDMQAQILTAMTRASGQSAVTENIFENRFMHVAELRRLGARIDVEGNTAIVTGPTELSGAPIMATDLRASACLVVAGLCAQGVTKISRIYHLDRGYQRMDEKLRALGAEIYRVAE